MSDYLEVYRSGGCSELISDLFIILYVGLPHTVLTSTLTICRRNRGDPSSLYRTYGALQVDILVWPGAAHAPIAV